VAAPTRRQFVQQLVWTSFGTYVAVAAGCKRRALPHDGAPAIGRALSAPELLLVSAVCDRLLPPDEDPGAASLGVPTFVDRALADPHYAGWLEGVRAGLQSLDDACQVRHGRGFADPAVGDDERDALLAEFQASPDPARRELFDRLLHLTVEGAFADPLHGGNRDGAAWRLIGFAPDDCSAPKPG
jgi:gluconate 2-dehydrogenase gamma chain